jgi:hypothetical protein
MREEGERGKRRQRRMILRPDVNECTCMRIDRPLDLLANDGGCSATSCVVNEMRYKERVKNKGNRRKITAVL